MVIFFLFEIDVWGTVSILPPLPCRNLDCGAVICSYFSVRDEDGGKVDAIVIRRVECDHSIDKFSSSSVIIKCPCFGLPLVVRSRECSTAS